MDLWDIIGIGAQIGGSLLGKSGQKAADSGNLAQLASQAALADIGYKTAGQQARLAKDISIANINISGRNNLLAVDDDYRAFTNTAINTMRSVGVKSSATQASVIRGGYKRLDRNLQMAMDDTKNAILLAKLQNQRQQSVYSGARTDIANVYDKLIGDTKSAQDKSRSSGFLADLIGIGTNYLGDDE